MLTEGRLDFNSHAHVERDHRNPDDCRAIHSISTHTLTWSVTINILEISLLVSYFNSHAHVERDVTTQKSIPTSQNFNSHAHVERDGAKNNTNVTGIDFNSHAHVERDLYVIVFVPCYA